MKGPERPCYIKPQQTSSRNVLQRSVEPAAKSAPSLKVRNSKNRKMTRIIFRNQLQPNKPAKFRRSGTRFGGIPIYAIPASPGLLHSKTQNGLGQFVFWTTEKQAQQLPICER